MKEFAFRLDPDADGWPPYPAEWLWLEEKDSHQIVKSPPLFVSGLAVDDEIELSDTNSAGEVTKWRLVSPGGRSVVWIADIGGSRLKEVLSEFRKIGCNTTSLDDIAHAAIDIPPEVSRAEVDAILDRLDEEEYAIAFPCDRQG